MKKKKQNITQSKKETKTEKVKKETTRRDFMKTAWKGLGVLAGLEFAGLTIHYLSDRDKISGSSNIFDAGLIEDFPNNSVTPFRKGHFYLVRLDDGGFIALSIKCSHLGCSVLWDEKENGFFCPCHSSKFDINGDVINPPAPRALDFYEIKIEKGKILVDLKRKIKRGEFKKEQVTYS